MTGVLGDPRCPTPGCRRERATSEGGIHYARCWGHTQALLDRSFSSAPQSPENPGPYPPTASAPGALPDGLEHWTPGELVEAFGR